MDVNEAVAKRIMDLCKEQKINYYMLSYRAAIPKSTVMNIFYGTNPTIILFNLLDNGIEANMKVPVKDRKLEVKIARQDDMMNIVIKNTILSSVLRSRAAFRTDKQDKELHGIGHVTVAELVDETGGIIEYYEEEKAFYAHVLIPIE